jgi:hypothetical protein
MISETTFATAYNSCWKTLIPNSERFIRRLNLNLQRMGPPLAATSRPERRAFINEFAFRLFLSALPNACSLETHLENYADLADEVRLYLSRFVEVKSPIVDPSVEEFEEARQIGRRIWNFISHTEFQGPPVIAAPSFRGCGILDACNGDLLVGDCLIEVKAGDRAFRAIDIRQLVIYCALNSIASSYEIGRVSCLNPRRGTYFVLDLNILSLEVASKSATDLFAEVVYLVSSGDLSR